MTDFYHYPAQQFSGAAMTITIASGPVIMNSDAQFLLHVSASTGKYQFTGGRLDDTKSPQENAVFRTWEDLGLRVTLTPDLEPFVVVDEIERDGKKELLTLIHYVASVEAGSTPTKGDWKWFTLDEIIALEKVGNVSSPNIRIACEYFLAMA